MTLSTDKSTITLNGDDVTTTFDFDFVVWDESEIAVWIDDGLGLSTSFTETDDFTVSLNVDQDNNPGGTVTYPVVGDTLASGEYITILRDMGFTQEVDLQTGVAFDPEVIETALDKVTAQCQQLKEVLNRAAIVDPGDTIENYLEDCEAAKLSAQAAQSAAEAAQAAAEAAQAAAEAAEANVEGYASRFVRQVYTETLSESTDTVTADFEFENVYAIVDGVFQMEGSFTHDSTSVTFSSALPIDTEVMLIGGLFAPVSSSDYDGSPGNYESLMTGDEVFTYSTSFGGRRVYLLDPNGADRNFTPSVLDGDFTTGFEAIIINTGDAYNIIADPAGVAEIVTPGVRSVLTYSSLKSGWRV